MDKKSQELHVMWHVLELVQIYPVTVVTTVDKHGTINAAPYSLVMPFCSSPDNPQMLLIVNRSWHTAKNIEATGEFVLNYPRADRLQDVMETGKFHDEGVNELRFTGFTTEPAKTVTPPRITECYQHIECTVNHIMRPSKTQINVIADVRDLAIDGELCDGDRLSRVKKLSLPAYLGLNSMQEHIFGKAADITAMQVDAH
jgi:flavin reductase (DIM6/NTAB) family NADH-FMN oxidoreductase RutF